MSWNCENDGAGAQSLLFAVDIRFDAGAVFLLLDVQNTGVGQDADLRSGCLRNAVHTVGEVPLAADKEVPDNLHQDDAGRGFDRAADGAVQSGAKDALENFFAAKAAEIALTVFIVEGPAEIALSMNERAMILE